MNIRLTSDSLRMFLNMGIPRSSLPNTIREACELCIGIGIRYLWVDSLCILQDVKSDWVEQSSLMGMLFNKSTLTISAARSKSCNTGIFVEDRDKVVEIAKLKCRTNDNNSSVCWVREMDQAFDGTREPTEYRAWTQQETLLSRRVFTLGTYQLSWQCATSYWNESGRMLAPSPYMKEMFPCPILHDSLKLYDDEKAEQPEGDALLRVWHELVSDYARRKLTMAKDKLPAISAVAKWLSAHSALTEDYVAGLWLSRLPADLMWFHTLTFPAETSQVVRPTSYRAPSWSWASLDCSRLEWYDIGTEAIKAKVIGHKLEYRSADTFAEVQGGYLDIDALVRTAWLVPQTSYPEAYELWDDDWQSALCGTNSTSTGSASGRVYLDAYDEDELLCVNQLKKADRVQERECVAGDPVIYWVGGDPRWSEQR
ncbi:hypothetical protein M409DRAFT_23889 [Zasmidium cellare ATCC 36951]|uniref:Heterokaryon incompatibility domain-containing protein n=1 Tax=Zasmidium cellare ATCC 36951 TaxID=1080233 RepID=A0A6A6CJJ9_ZASCE|nr:uncharacterized protein M409DRAFT_23889 [Zasmidium cellare ATCC 36951]KAF2165596.1 hypothetical protein M409DRAFT_23889 [Zasmidium cellare ATCC 36951]